MASGGHVHRHGPHHEITQYPLVLQKLNVQYKAHTILQQAVTEVLNECFISYFSIKDSLLSFIYFKPGCLNLSTQVKALSLAE